MFKRALVILILAFFFSSALHPEPEAAPRRMAFVGARIVNGSGETIENGILLVRDGRIEAVGRAGAVRIPDGVAVEKLAGKTIIPGLINAHAHVGTAKGLKSGPEYYTRENILNQLEMYARYGVTTVFSLGDSRDEGIRVREIQNDPALKRARLYVAGIVPEVKTPEEARQQVTQLAAMNVDLVKIRVDDNLGTREKMPPEIYRAVIDQAHQKGLRVAAHIFYLGDTKSLLRSGVDFIAHSVRDQVVDQEFISLLKERGVCLCPTLVREVSTFVYGERPDFFDDPFFLRYADQKVIRELEDPRRQQEVRSSPASSQYRKALEVAKQNLKILTEAGIPIAFGTDTGPPARFQGYFEHLELELMADAGLTPAQILSMATSQAARCLRIDDEVGSLAPGKWADFVVLDRNPLEDIKNTRSIHSVWIAGNRVSAPSAD